MSKNKNYPSRKQNRDVKTNKHLKRTQRGNLQLVQDQAIQDGVRNKDPITPKTESQQAFYKSLIQDQVSVYIAPAGVGKTYLTTGVCAEWLEKGIYERIIIARPAVGMGNTVGFLKGDADQKYTPFITPMLEGFKSNMSKQWLESQINNGNIIFQLLEYARGMSYGEDDILILDEAQNTKPNEMFTMLTRMGQGSKLIILGDVTQSDIRGESGLQWLESFVEDNPDLGKYIRICGGTSDDIVRGGLCKEVVKAKERSLEE